MSQTAPPTDQRMLLRYLVAAFLARISIEGARIVFVLLAVERTGNATAGGLLVSAFLVPNVVAAPVVGRIADRSRHRTRVHAVAFAIFAVAMLLACLSLDRVPLWISLAIAVAGGVAGPLLTGGMTSLVGNVVTPASRHRAYSLDILTYNVAGIAGPGLAAVIAGWRSALDATWLLVLFAAIAAGLVSTLKLLPADPDEPVAHGPSRLLDGLDVFWQSRTLASSTVANSLSSGSHAALAVAIVIIGERHWSDGWTAAALTASACGAVVGSISYARWPFGTEHPERMSLQCLAALTVPLAALLLTSNPLIAVVALTISGYGTGPMNAAVFMVRDRAAGARSRTQVFTLAASMKMTIAAGGAALAGILATSGPEPVLWFVLGCNVLGVVSGSAILARTRATPHDAGPSVSVDRASAVDSHA